MFAAIALQQIAAWLLEQKLMQAMVEGEHDRMLHGVVQMDDAYWGGERHGGQHGRGSPGKTPFVPAVACTLQGHPLPVRIDKADGFRKTILADWAAWVLVPGCQVVSDGLNCFAAVGGAGRCRCQFPSRHLASPSVGARSMQ